MNITSIPSELLANYLLDLPYAAIISYCQTSTSAARICNDPLFWTRKSMKQFGLPLDIVTNTNLNAFKRYRQLNEMLSAPFNITTSLELAVQAGDLGLVEYLIPVALQVNHPLKDILYKAVQKGHINIVNYLVPLIKSRTTGTSAWDKPEIEIILDAALLNAYTYGHVNIIDYLISVGATNVIIALQLAVYDNRLDVIQHLIEKWNISDQQDLDELADIARRNN